MEIKKTGLVLLVAGVFFACTKDPAQPVPPPPAEEKPIIELGRISMVKEGKTWSYPARAYYYNVGKYSKVVIDYKLIKDNLEEHFYISDLPNKIGKFKMERDISANNYNSSPQVAISWLLDLDQAMGAMSVDTTKEGNWLEIIRYDSIQKVYEGRFEMHLERTRGITIGLPEKVHVTDGKFHVKVKQ